MNLRYLEAWGLGTLLLLSEIYPVMNVNGLSAYHSSTPSWPTLMLALAGMVVFAGLYMGALYLSRGKGGRGVRVAMAVVLPMLVLLANRYAFKYMAIRLHGRMVHEKLQVLVVPISLKQAAVGFGVWVILMLVLLRRAPKWYGAIVAGGRIALLAVGLLGCVTVVDMFRAMAEHRHDHDFVAMHQRSATEEIAHPRIVWIIFDELSYNQVFEHRFPGLNLPNFDALAAQSDVYTNAQPVAYFTDLAVPSLLIGEQADAVHFTFSTGVRFLFHGEKTMRGFDGARTLPAEAQRKGWNVGVVGWWNPYCMLMAGYMQSCRWAWREDWSDPKMRAKYSPGKNVEQWVGGLFANRPFPQVLPVRDEENKDFYRWSLVLLNNPDMDFIFLHLTPPHPPAISDRHVGLDTLKPGSYIDGLALADRTLGRLMSVIESSPRWPNTTVIVNGDHSWRVGTYRAEDDWTPEDEEASDGGKFDIRPTMIVHHPGQSQEHMIDAPTPLLELHGIAQSIIQTGGTSNAGGASAR